MNKIPFSVYDFFAYLSSGAVVLTTIDYVWGLGVLRRKEVGPVLGIALVILAYVTGQIVAQFSSFLFEHIIVKRVLQRPFDFGILKWSTSAVCFGPPRHSKLLFWI